MIIDLKPWQKQLVTEMLEALPPDVRAMLEQSVQKVISADRQSGDGFFHEGVVYLSHGIRHPRLLLERLCHEWGHALELRLEAEGVKIGAAVSEAFADAFALVLLYPERLAAKGFKPIRRILAERVFGQGLVGIDTEGLIARYARIVSDLDAAQRDALGPRIEGRLQEMFQAQSRGFLRKGQGDPSDDRGR